MKIEPPAPRREFKAVALAVDVVVAGGGLAGTCCAIAAARAGAKVVLIQDRPVLGGNASSEIRLWVLGATAHNYNNNRWAREGGILDEVLVENMFRNPEGNALIFDTILLGLAHAEPNLTLLLNTAVIDVATSGEAVIRSVRAFCSQNSTAYEVTAPVFCDATGDGAVGFLAGAAFRMGAEPAAEFGEKFAPTQSYGELLGHSMYFYSKDTGKPVTFTPPAYALSDITKVPRWKAFRLGEFGCALWWIEYGGRLDTVHDTETIKWELWKVVYGVWNHIKNSGHFPEAATHTLEWVGQIPGKRESRRFEGPYLINQHDVVEQRRHDDDVAFGGWSIDLHPADGIYSEKPGCDQWHAKGVFPIPYRCLFSRNIANLFLVGRTMSATHVAFGSTRVMATLSACGQAAGLAAAACARDGKRPADLVAPERMKVLQRDLLRTGQYIPNVALDDPDDFAKRATITASSEFELKALPPGNDWCALEHDWAQMIPVPAGPAPTVTFTVKADAPTDFVLELRRSSKPFNHTPDVTVSATTVPLKPGEQAVAIPGGSPVPEACYLFYVLRRTAGVSVRLSELRVTGLDAVHHHDDQKPEHDIGVETFEFWSPRRRPEGMNLACMIAPALRPFAAAIVTNGIARPVAGPNAWVADPGDRTPSLTLAWTQPVTVGRIVLGFDTDWNHPMESVLRGHPERAMPFCVRRYRITDERGAVLHARADNHQTRNEIRLAAPVTTSRLTVHCDESWGPVPAALFEVRVYSD